MGISGDVTFALWNCIIFDPLSHMIFFQNAFKQFFRKIPFVGIKYKIRHIVL